MNQCDDDAYYSELDAEYLSRIEELEKENEQLKQQIEKMKMCGNCGLRGDCENDSYYDTDVCNKWELAE